MGAKSEKYGDVTLWVEKVIKSCTTKSHISGAQKLIKNFDFKYVKKIDHKVHFDTCMNLHRLLLKRNDQIKY